MANGPLSSPSERARQAFADYVLRVAGGEVVDFEQWCVRHPDVATELRVLHGVWLNEHSSTLALDTPLSVRIQQIVGEGVDSRVALDRRDEGRADVDGPGTDRIGRYDLREELARGGQGAILRVYDQDLRRNLAMKVVLGGDEAHGRAPISSLAPKALGRFLEEAQVTAQLDHPGIVPVHELGLDAGGSVYFTMKLVRGEDLGAVYAKVAKGEEGWTRTRALWVLIKVCEAMAYAHHKGVIHRDLKPANVMVGGFGEVYVMDWGLARVLDEERAEDAVQPDELAGVGSGGIDPMRTMDGDVLGTPSYMPPEQALGRISEMGPHSDVYSLGAMLYELLAGHRPYAPPGTERNLLDILLAVQERSPEALSDRAPDAPLELVAICEKAMAREPECRYADVGELGQDLRAFLEGRVVQAFETGALAELRKWVARNRPLAVTIAAGILALVVGLATTLVQKGRADRNALLAQEREQLAVRAEARATREAERANAEAARASHEAETAQRTVDFLTGLFEVVDPGEARGNTITAREILDRGSTRIDRELGGQPEVQSSLMATMGTVYKSLGLYERAAPLMERALDTRLEVFGDEHELVASTLNGLGDLKRRMARFAEAEPILRRALALRVEEQGPTGEGVAETQHELGLVLVGLGRLAEAEQLFRTSLATRRELLGRHPDVAASLNALAFCLYDLGDREAPAALLRESLDIRSEVLGTHPDTAEGLNDLGVFLFETGDVDEAETYMREGLAMKRELFTDVHPEVALSLNNLAVALATRGQYDEADVLYTEALDIQRELLGAEHPDLAQAIHNVAILRHRKGDWEGAKALFLESLDIYEVGYGLDHPSVELPLRNTIDFQREWIEQVSRAQGRSSVAVGVELLDLSSLLRRSGAADEAVDAAVEAVEAFLGDPQAEPWQAAVAETALGGSLAELREFTEAEGVLLGSYETLLELRGPESPETLLAVEELVRLYEIWERKDADRFRALLPARNEGDR